MAQIPRHDRFMQCLPDFEDCSWRKGSIKGYTSTEEKTDTTGSGPGKVWTQTERAVVVDTKTTKGMLCVGWPKVGNQFSIFCEFTNHFDHVVCRI